MFKPDPKYVRAASKQTALQTIKSLLQVEVRSTAAANVKEWTELASVQVDATASLGILELFVLVAALRLHRRGYERVNFELLWAEYAKTAGMHHADVYSKPAAARAFQRLLDASLLFFTDARCAHQ